RRRPRRTRFCRRPFRSNPSSACDENIFPHDFDFVSPNAQRWDRCAFAVLQVEIETMPGAEDLAAVQKAFDQRRATVRAQVADRVILAVEIEQGDLLSSDLDQTAGPQRNLAD